MSAANDPVVRDLTRELMAEGRVIPNVLPREFHAYGEDQYSFSIPDLRIVLEVDRLRRERNELIGELSVRCGFPGARTVNGSSLSVANLNLSSARARLEHAKMLAERARIQGLDWLGVLEDFCQRVLDADRTGQPAVDLRELPRPSKQDESYEVLGLAFPKRHPTILFGDGGTAKSYLALYALGRIAEMGRSVALFDWELSGEEHRERIELLFTDGMPRILYVRCERPLVFEADRLRRIVRENQVEYAVYDSVAFASDGPPEAAEVAGRYFRAVRQIGCGSLHVAHVSKAADADRKPFGSSFWHNGARSTWFAKLADETAGSDTLKVGLYHRKSNLGRLRAPVGFAITFEDHATLIRATDLADSPDLASHLTIKQRMIGLLRRGSMDPAQIAEEIEADPETVRRTIRRHKNLFTVIEGGRVGLLDSRS